MSTETPTRPVYTFFEQVIAMTPGDPHLERCIQCGTCGGSCPSGGDMELTPRALFALLAAGEKESVLNSSGPWYCVSCYYCMARCPKDIHVTDLMYTLKRYALQTGHHKRANIRSASGFSGTFIWNVEHFGRSFELGLAAAYHLVHHPLGLPKMMPLALGLLTKGRMALLPRPIKHMAELKSILQKAKDLEEEDWQALEVGKE